MNLGRGLNTNVWESYLFDLESVMIENCIRSIWNVGMINNYIRSI